MSVSHKESRRKFLKGVVCATAASSLTVDCASAQTPQQQWTLVIDLNRCMGCQSCTIACKAEQNPMPGTFFSQMRIEETSPTGRLEFLPQMCMHCDTPACQSACPTNAIIKQPDGIVLTDWNACIGDGACINACPYMARSLDTTQGNKAASCDLCAERLARGRIPACVESCASGARIFGDAASPSQELANYLPIIKTLRSQEQKLPKGRVVIVPLCDRRAS